MNDSDKIDLADTIESVGRNVALYARRIAEDPNDRNLKHWLTGINAEQTLLSRLVEALENQVPSARQGMAQ
jgi:hypothetical protein